jgi:hypothetical protein
MVAAWNTPHPDPIAPLGRRLCEIFGQHPWDFIQAPPRPPSDKPQWKTVTDYPLRPRVLWAKWQDPDQLIGVRFNSQTRYGLLDIDATSPYCNPESLAEIRAALETIGIVRTLLIRSSHSGGLHLYIPLPEPIKTFDLAVALHECLTAQGFQFTNGQLEQFPNVKTYGNERIIHYNGHRLPLQPHTGSCLLDNDLNPTSDRLTDFLHQWQQAASQQDLNELRHALKIGRDNHRKRNKKQRQASPRSEAWRQDLETEINDGWSGPGQTNHLLKTIACHGHVFLHLQDDTLIQHTLETAQNLPGYQQHCRHQHHIATRITAWCKAVQNYYWPQGTEPKRDTRTDLPPTPSVNHQRAQDAKERIQAAYQHLEHSHQLPERISDRAQALMAQARTSKETLYKPENLPLWHPEHRLTPVLPQPASHSAPQPSPQHSRPKSLKPSHNKKVRTSERFMKCKPVLNRQRQSSGERGVRGEFPQASAALQTPAQVPTLALTDLACPLPPPATPAEQDHHCNQITIRRCVTRLQWQPQDLVQYIAQQFNGRRYHQLRSDEVMLLIYRLSLLVDGETGF